VRIEVPAHWADHRFLGRAVLPGVEAMQLLAFWTRRFRPAVQLQSIGQAAFDKFLELPPAGEAIEAYCDLTDLPHGVVQAALVTRRQAKTAALTRTITHAQVVYKPSPPPVAAMPLDMSAALAGPCFSVAPDHLYESLVPFGPHYRNIAQPLQLAREGALTLIHAPDLADHQTDMPLGSPFVPDAAFHAACVWSQRFAGVVAFPVGIAERRVVDPTRPGETYVGRVFPVRTDGATLVFDIWVLGLDGKVRELLTGVRMRDVSGGRLRPPEWISAMRAPPAPGDVKGCVAMTLIERDNVMPFAEQCLSGRERQRLEKMGPKRRKGFLAARLACKRLSRTLEGNDWTTPAHEIETLAADGIRPSCPSGPGKAFHYCSVAHDRRFAVAVSAGHPIGVDVETPDACLLKALHFFTNGTEQAQVRFSALGEIDAAVRVWSVKEAVAKVLGITLADAWQRTEVIRIGSEESRLRIDNGPPAQAFHKDIGNHVVTWVVLR